MSARNFRSNAQLDNSFFLMKEKRWCNIFLANLVVHAAALWEVNEGLQ